METVCSFDSILPHEHYKELLKADSRPDGRELGQFRKVTVNVGSIGTANGSALVQIGETMVVCGIKAELTKPTAAEPEKGFIVPNVDLSPMCASHFRPGPPSDQAQVASQFLYEVIKSCKVVDLEKLCIQKDKLVWVLYCDILCLNYDGNINDACILAIMAALQNTLLPKVVYDEEHDSIKTEAGDKEVTKLSIRKLASSTFTQFESKYTIADPNLKEEAITSGEITIVTDDQNNVCYIHRPGGPPLTDASMKKCINAAVDNGKKLCLVLDELSPQKK